MRNRSTRCRSKCDLRSVLRWWCLDFHMHRRNRHFDDGVRDSSVIPAIGKALALAVLAVPRRWKQQPLSYRMLGESEHCLACVPAGKDIEVGTGTANYAENALATPWW